MRTLGIDLAAQAPGTAMCGITWSAGSTAVEAPLVGCDDAMLLEAMATADATAIDAPFGWPDAMVSAVAGFAVHGTWPVDAATVELRFRLTDRAVPEISRAHRGRTLVPLSVSSDLIANCAFRCARLLAGHAAASGRPLDRVGLPPTTGATYEAYPAGALLMWGLPYRGYKHPRGPAAAVSRELRAALLASIEEELPTFTLSDPVRAALTASDHALDAFVCALVARAAAMGLTIAPDPGDTLLAAREGWIHLPVPDALRRLGEAAPHPV